jgi:hypothetical protein
MSTPKSIVQRDILDPARLQRTSQARRGTAALTEPKYFLRVPESKLREISVLANRQVTTTTAEQLPKGAAAQSPKLVDIEVKPEELESVRQSPELAPYLRVVYPTETKNDTAIAVAMMNSAAARETGAMQSLGLSPDQVIYKYTQFVGTLGTSFNDAIQSVATDLTSISENLTLLDDIKLKKLQAKFQLMDTIIGSLLRLVPGGSIGSLSDGTGQTAQDQIGALKGAQRSLQNVKDQIKGLKDPALSPEERNTKITDIVKQLRTISTSNVDSTIKTIVGGGERAPTVRNLSSGNSLLQDFRIIQFIATGVDLLEKLEPKAEGSAERQLYDALNSNLLGAYGPKMDFMKTVRQSGFFMEYSYKELDERIAETFANQVAGSLVPEGADDSQRKAIHDAVSTAVTEKLEKLRNQTGEPDKIKGGFRGRDVSTQVGGHQRPLKQIFSQQGPAEIRGKPVGYFLTLDGLRDPAKRFFQAVRNDGGFNRPFRPQQNATPDVIDPHRVAMLNDPVGFLQDALRDARQSVETQPFNQLEKQKAAIQQLLQTKLLDTLFKDELVNPESKDLSSPKKGTSWQIRNLVDQDPTTGQYTSKPSFAASMIDHGLQTFCSISGTTTDIVVGMVAQMGGDSAGKAAMAKILRPLVQLAEDAAVATPPLTPKQFADQVEGNQDLHIFKDLFLSVALYMQSGQYHTASEVLAGLYCAALNVYNPPHPSATDVEAFGERFERLCAAFQSNPAAFFPPATSQSEAA